MFETMKKSFSRLLQIKRDESSSQISNGNNFPRNYFKNFAYEVIVENKCKQKVVIITETNALRSNHILVIFR